MKVLSFGDLHIHSSHYFSKPTRDNYTIRLVEHIDCMKWIASKILEIKPDVVDLGGDIFHTQGSIATDTLDAASVCVTIVADACAEVGAKLIIVVGNHDLLSNEAEQVHATKVFKNYKNVAMLVEKSMVIDGLAFVPYTKNKDQLARFLMEKGKADVCLSHLDMHGARFHATMCDEHGVPPNMFTNFKKVINHHYHLPQTIQVGDTEIFMPGAPQEWSFREPKGQVKRGICLLDTDDWSIVQIENDYSPAFVICETLDQVLAAKPNDYLMVKVLFENDLKEFREAIGDRRYEVEIEVDRSYRDVDIGVDRDNLSTTVEEDIRDFVDKVETGGMKKETLLAVGLNMTKNV